MIRLTRSVGGLEWISRAGVKLLSWEERCRAMEVSVSKFPRGRDGEIDWSAAGASRSVLYYRRMGSDSVPEIEKMLQLEIKEALDSFSQQSENVILLWRNLAFPSVQLVATSFESHLPGIIESIPDFWIYCAGDGVIVDVSFAGDVTVAKILN